VAEGVETNRHSIPCLSHRRVDGMSGEATPGREAVAQAAVSEQRSGGQSAVDLKTAIQVVAKETIPRSCTSR